MSADQLINNISDYILTPAIYLLFATSFLIFVYGVYNYFDQLDNKEARGKGGQHMLWGILGMFLMISAKFLIRIIVNTIGAGDALPPDF